MQPRVANHATMHQLNRAAILRLIRRHGPISRVELSRMVNLSKPAVSAVVRELLDQQVVREIGYGASVTGRKPVMLEFAADAGTVIGVDLGVTEIRTATADLDGTILTTAKHSLRSREAEVVLDTLVASIREALKGRTSPLRTVVIGQPGVLDPRSGRGSLAPNLPRWGDLDVLSALQSEFRVPVVLENDVNLAAIGEWTYGAGKGTRNCVYVNLGAGLGAGIILDGKLYRGSNGASGEIGYMLLDDPTQVPFDARRGQLEALAGGEGIRERALALLTGSDTRQRSSLGNSDPGAVTAETVFDAAKAGDELARQLALDVVGRLTRAIVTLSVLFDPDIVVLGGGLTRAGDILLRPIAEGVRLHCPYPPRIVQSHLGGSAELRGALAVGVQVVASALELGTPPHDGYWPGWAAGGTSPSSSPELPQERGKVLN